MEEAPSIISTITKTPNMTTDELIQLIRTCNLSQVRAELDKSKPEALQAMEQFYLKASKRKP